MGRDPATAALLGSLIFALAGFELVLPVVREALASLVDGEARLLFLGSPDELALRIPISVGPT